MLLKVTELQRDRVTMVMSNLLTYRKISKFAYILTVCRRMPHAASLLNLNLVICLCLSQLYKASPLLKHCHSIVDAPELALGTPFIVNHCVCLGLASSVIMHVLSGNYLPAYLGCRSVSMIIILCTRPHPLSTSPLQQVNIHTVTCVNKLCICL